MPEGSRPQFCVGQRGLLKTRAHLLVRYWRPGVLLRPERVRTFTVCSRSGQNRIGGAANGRRRRDVALFPRIARLVAELASVLVLDALILDARILDVTSAASRFLVSRIRPRFPAMVTACSLERRQRCPLHAQEAQNRTIFSDALTKALRQSHTSWRYHRYAAARQHDIRCLAAAYQCHPSHVCLPAHEASTR